MGLFFHFSLNSPLANNFKIKGDTKAKEKREKKTNLATLKGAQSRFAHIEKFSLNFSNSLFVIRVNLLHP